MATKATVLLLACGLALGACGDGGGEGADPDPQAAIEKTIETFSRTDDPADCRRLATARFLVQTGSVGYDAALSACEEAAVDPLVEDAKKVTISEIQVDGDAATAVASYRGSGFDGQTIRVALVERDGQWKHDELVGFVDFDADKMVTALGRELLLQAKFREEAELMSCVVSGLRRLEDGELEGILLGESPELLLQVAQGCAGRSSAL
jgi:hypothetical protein